MRTTDEIFLTVGVPIAHSSRDYGPNNYTGFRAFNEHDIKAIQDEAFKAGLTRAAVIADGYLQSMGSRDGMNVASLIKEEIVSDSKYLDPAKLR